MIFLIPYIIPQFSRRKKRAPRIFSKFRVFARRAAKQGEGPGLFPGIEYATMTQTVFPKNHAGNANAKPCGGEKTQCGKKHGEFFACWLYACCWRGAGAKRRPRATSPPERRSLRGRKRRLPWPSGRKRCWPPMSRRCFCWPSRIRKAWPIPFPAICCANWPRTRRRSRPRCKAAAINSPTGRRALTFTRPRAWT